MVHTTTIALNMKSANLKIEFTLLVDNGIQSVWLFFVSMRGLCQFNMQLACVVETRANL